MRRTITTLLFLLLLCGGQSLYAGDPSPDFTLEDMNGDLFTLADQLGEGIILLDFWATWCTPCKHELPYLQELHEKYSEEGFMLITISEDSPKSQSKVRPYVRSKRYTFPVLLDPNSEVLRLFQGSTLPYRVIIDEDGNIVETHQGYNPGDEVILEEKVRELLKLETAGE
jgi:peroxiredoxin